jgi:ribosome-associated protein
MPRIPFNLDPAQIEYSAIRAQGAGGQNVNKVSSAVQLRFDIRTSSLPAELQERLLAWPDQRITKEGVVVIKAQEYRTQEQNRADAWQRLEELLRAAAFIPRTRKATRPTYGSKQRRLEGKSKRGEVKKNRGKVEN